MAAQREARFFRRCEGVSLRTFFRFFLVKILPPEAQIFLKRKICPSRHRRWRKLCLSPEVRPHGASDR